MSDEKKATILVLDEIKKSISESQRLERLKDVRAPIISEVMAENPGLTEEQLTQMMDEMGF